MYHLIIYTLGPSSQPLHIDVEDAEYNLLLKRDIRWLKGTQSGSSKEIRIRANAIVFFLTIEQDDQEHPHIEETRALE